MYAHTTCIRHHLIELLDRPGSRFLLAILANAKLRLESSGESRLLHDKLWIQRWRDIYFPLSTDYCRYPGTVIPAVIRDTLQRSEDYWCYAYKPKPGDVVIDVGAGIGIDTLLFSQAVGPSGTVIAIEAHPKTFQQLLSVCRHNDLANTRCHQFAICDRTGPVAITDNFSKPVANTIMAASSRKAYHTRAIPLHLFFRELSIGHVDFLKMNIEGAELLAINGMHEVMPKIKNICIACHDFLNQGRQAPCGIRATIVEFLRANGFQTKLRDDHHLPYVREHVHGFRI